MRCAKKVEHEVVFDHGGAQPKVAARPKVDAPFRPVGSNDENQLHSGPFPQYDDANSSI